VAAAVTIIEGSRLLGRAYAAFRSPTVSTGSDLNSRLFSASGNARADYWRVAWHDVEAHPAGGSGAGTFELWWDRERPNAFGARDAHNLYLETLAELGPLGLGLLVIALGAPLVALRGERTPLAAGAGAAYAAYLVHAGIDWDWEVPTVTLAALACAAALLVAARRTHGARAVPLAARAAGVGVALLLAAFAGIGYVQATALASARDALRDGALDRAASDARRAARLAPWQAEPWTMRGQAQLARGERAQAAASFRRAVAKDGADWFPWYELALASRGAARERALSEALQRNPREPALAALREH
jgi:Flp pilus assembly protein TadD